MRNRSQTAGFARRSHISIDMVVSGGASIPRMTTPNLSESERETLVALTNASSTDPNCRFEHVRGAVQMRGRGVHADLRVDRETLRRLGRLRLIRFTSERDGFGRALWTFEVMGDAG